MLDVAAAVPTELDRAGLTPRQQTARARIVARRNRLTQLWDEGAGHAGDHSMYEAYNATAESIDHDADLWRVRGPRTGALLDGRLAEVKNRVLAGLVVAPRDGYPDASPDFLERHFPGARARTVFLDGPRMRLSASELRARATAGRSLRYLVPDAVAAYIGDHALYQTT